MDGDARATGIGVPDRRVVPDRRARPTPVWGALCRRGHRRGFRRAGEGDGASVDCPAPRIVVLTLTVFVASLVDAGLTLHHLAQGGNEANILMVWALSKGATPFLGLKIGLTGLGVGCLAAHQQYTLARYGLYGMTLVYGALLGAHALFILGWA